MKKVKKTHGTAVLLLFCGVVLLTATLVALFASSFGPSAQPPEAGTVVVYKSATCSCCSRWVEHLRLAGLNVEVRNEDDLSSIKTRLGVSQDLASCHTATVSGYVIEGHVPAAEIRRLLIEKPKARGLAVPEMPIGAPGMEQGDVVNPYTVLLFGGTGETQIYAQYGAPANR